MAKNPKYKHFYKVIKELREEFPADLPVKVLRKSPPKGYIEYTAKSKKCYYIVIDKKEEEHIAVYMLLHAWAHVRTFDVQKVDHGVKFGEEYNRIYRSYEKRHLKD